MLTPKMSGGRGSGVIPVLLSCALMVVVLLGLTLMDKSWSGPVIAVALIACLLLMVALGGVMHATDSSSMAPQNSLRRGDTEAIRAMLRSRPIAPDEQDRPAHVQFQVNGLTCAAEAAALAHKLRARDGVLNATVNPVTECAYIDYTDRLVDAATLAAVIKSAGYGVE
jgi:copper chaperone CopZ